AVGSERDGLVQSAHGALRAHRYSHDLLDGGDAALANLHRSLDGVRVIRVEVLLPAAVHAPRRAVDALLDGGVRDLLHQDANLHSANSFRDVDGAILPELTDESIRGTF